MKFIDEARIRVKAGDGGRGCISFYRGPHIPKGGPDGGDGGRGGSIYLEASTNVQTLLDFKYKSQYRARRGEDGRGKNCNGRAAEDIVLLVPLGTHVRSDDGLIDEDLTENGQRILVAKGGEGGKGNTHFKSSTRQAPRISSPPGKGEEREIYLELKVLSDVGLVGLPNAGKSSLLRALSAARPKVGDYPFTTLQPHLGVVGEHSFVLADIPGLIKGAHENLGLGHKFLRHISRSRVLLFLLSFEPGQSLEENLKTLKAELELYDPSMKEKPFLIAVNKSDLLEESQEFKEDWKSFQELHPDAILVSAKHHKGLEELVQKIEERLSAEAQNVVNSNC